MTHDRFEDSPGLFGEGIGSATHGEFHCDFCGMVYFEGADRDENYDNEGVGEALFAGMNVGDCCFWKVEMAVWNSRIQILQWFDRIMERRRKAVDGEERLMEKLGHGEA